SFDPLNLDILHALANAYNQRYNRAEDPADKQQALLVAQRCLALKPSDKEAQVLISFLEHTAENTQEKLSQWTRQKLTVLAGGLATVGLGIVVVSRLPVFSASPALLGPAPGTIVPGSAIYDTDSTDGTDEADQGPNAAARATAIDLVSDVDIPVIFDHPGLVLEARLSELGDYEDEVYYQLQGVFINASDQEFRKLMLNVEFLDRSDVAIATKGNQAIGPRDASLRPGDTHAFSLIQKINSDLVTVRLSVTDTEQAIARNTYVPPTPINYSWDTLESETISFELASRSEIFGATGTAAPSTESEPGSNNDKKPGEPDTADEKTSQSGPANFNAEWVIINTSDYPVQELTLKADFYDANSQRLQSEEVIVIDNNDAPLLPGETRPFRVIKAVASGYERYKVSVLEAE
ncbi:MAG: FxLYD domain-containing protein, partial [Cyanobacteria bacterium J06636_28]